MAERTIALVEDHALIAVGFRDLVEAADGLTLAGTVETVADLASLGATLDLVVLDLRLTDGSLPADNVAAIHRMGAHVLIYTGAEDRRLIQSAARSGALGLIRKSSEPEVLIDAIRTAAEGREVFGTDWAAAIDADAGLQDAKLSRREQEILSLYASGETAATVARRTGLSRETAATVARRTGLSRETVADYVSRIRRKYADAGRPAQSRIDLYKRAVEDGYLGIDG
ncbi:response regulator transcription factor [Demequina sp. NBRC 110052]|uniref:response regulator transcription factor n=1 Tax=Demequina sp. NBRC 110052 TaxID=1570341 RepID=UPI000A058C21|nr:response regulator transcription factor [Demequina sp. NBRC 110052]